MEFDSIWAIVFLGFLAQLSWCFSSNSALLSGDSVYLDYGIFDSVAILLEASVTDSPNLLQS